MSPELLLASDRVLSDATNGLYQGILLTAMVGLGLRLIPGTNAATRHATWIFTLLLIAAFIPAQWCREYSLSTQTRAGSVALNASGEPNRTSWAADAKAAALAVERTPPPRDDSASGLSIGGAIASLGEGLSAGERGNARAVPAELAQARSDSGQVGQAGAWKPLAWHIGPGSKAAEAGGLVLLAAWVMGVGLRFGRLLLQLRQIRTLKKKALPVEGPVTAAFQRCRAKLNVTRPVALKTSDQLRSPLLLGFRHPVVLMPAAALQELELEQVEQIVAHELAHVRRWDDWASLIQQLVQAVLFFHPAVWWVSRRLAVEREIASDDLVLDQGQQPRTYARLLLEFAIRLQKPPPQLTPGIWTSKSQLQQRIRMILDTHRCASPHLAKARLGYFTSAATSIAIVVLCLGPRFVLARDPSADLIAGPDQPVVNANGSPGVTAPELSVQTEVETAIKPDVIIKTEQVQQNISDDALANAEPPASPEPPGIRPGPKFKPPTPPRPHGPRPEPAPQAQAVPEGTAPGGIEERLDRLERMVQALVAQQNPKRARPERPPAERDFQKAMPSAKDLDELKMMARRGDLRALEDAKRAAKDVERARKLEEARRDMGRSQEGLQSQIKALQKGREALQREMERLGRQIERLQHEQEMLQQKQQRHSDNQNENSDSGDAAEEGSTTR